MRRLPAAAILGTIVAATCTVSPTETVSRGAFLFARHCAICHGVAGDADTPVARLLLPRPDAFSDGLFKLVSTRNGIPTEDDLVHTLHHGMPGSTMMAWSWMPESDLRALAQEVHRLAVGGRASAIRDLAGLTSRPISREHALSQANREFVPGAVVETGTMPVNATEALLAEGEHLYHQHCASCHGPDGTGLPQTRDWPSGATWLWPRDFTSGQLRGGSSYRELAYRVRAGMPGAHMPPTRLSPGETEALVTFVRRMIPDGAGEQHAQWRRTVRAAHLGRLPDESSDEDLPELDSVRLPAAALRWRPDAIDEVRLRAAHDANELLLEFSWHDATRDDVVRPDASMSDGIAVQFAHDPDPPLFAMGSEALPVNVWRWHAYDPRELAGITDLDWLTPRSGLDILKTLQLQPRAESIQLGGIGTVSRSLGSGLPLRVAASWHDGRWRATFRRALKARTGHEVDLTGAGPQLFSVAIWDGEIDRHPGSKSITAWHALELER